MLSKVLKESTKEIHAWAERRVMGRLNEIKDEKDYIALLKIFYVFFKSMEDVIYPVLTPHNQHLIADRRDASYILQDIRALDSGVEGENLSKIPAPVNIAEAIGMLYVLEGSTLGGIYIVKILKKKGIERGFSFFEGYGEDTFTHWEAFKKEIDGLVHADKEQKLAIQRAEQAFTLFGNLLGG